MALFSSILRQLFERFAHFLRRRETSQMAQQCAAQDLAAQEKLPEAFDFTTKNRKCRKRRRQYSKKEEERQVKRKVKKERERNEGGSLKDSSEHREVGEKKRRKRKLKERETTEPTPLLVEVKPQPTPVRSSFLKPIEAEPMLPSVSEHLALPAARFKPLPPVTKRSMHPQNPAPAPEKVTLPGTPLQVDPPSVSEHFALPAARFKPLRPMADWPMHPQKPAPAPEEVTLPGTPLQVDPPSVSEHFALPAARFKPLRPMADWPMHPQKPAPAPEEVTLPGTPLQVDPPSVSEHFPLPAARFKPLRPVTTRRMRPHKPAPAPEEVTLPGTPLQVDPPKLLAVPPRPTPAPDGLFSFRCSQVSLPKRLVVALSSTPASDKVVALQCSSIQVSPPCLLKPQPSTSCLYEPSPQLMLIDIEDEENEYVEYTGRTKRICDLPKSECPQLLEARINPRMAAWLESDSEVLEKMWESEVVDVQGFEKEKDTPDETGDSNPIQGHLDKAFQKMEEIDEQMMKQFCVTSPEGLKNETQHHENVQEEPRSKRKVSLFLFTWAEKKAKKKEEKKIRKEKEQRDKELLLKRYRNDPKLKHLLINKHNRHYRSSE